MACNSQKMSPWSSARSAILCTISGTLYPDNLLLNYLILETYRLSVCTVQLSARDIISTISDLSSLSLYISHLPSQFRISVRVPREGELEKSPHTLTLGGQTHSYVIFSNSIFCIRNCAVKWFGRDHISFGSGRQTTY